jgi:hypothetical protein
MSQRSIVPRWCKAFLLAGLPCLQAVAAGPTDALLGETPEAQKLSIRVELASTATVLQRLQQQGSMPIRVTGVLPDELVSLEFDGVELREALRRLFAAHSHLLLEQPASDASGPAVEIILLGRGPESLQVEAAIHRPTPAGVAPAAAGAPPRLGRARLRLEERPIEELADAAVSASSPRTRAAALDALAYRAAGDEQDTEHALAVLAGALSDPDRRVRAQALTTLKDTAENLPVEALVRVARDDERPALRSQALELLAERNGEAVREFLQAATADVDPEVQARARTLLEEL